MCQRTHPHPHPHPHPPTHSHESGLNGLGHMGRPNVIVYVSSCPILQPMWPYRRHLSPSIYIAARVVIANSHVNSSASCGPRGHGRVSCSFLELKHHHSEFRHDLFNSKCTKKGVTGLEQSLYDIAHITIYQPGLYRCTLGDFHKGQKWPLAQKPPEMTMAFRLSGVYKC